MRIMLSAGLSVRDHEFTNRGAARGADHFQEYRVSLNYLSPHFSRGVDREVPWEFLRFSKILIDMHIHGKIYQGCCVFKHVMKPITSDLHNCGYRI